MDLIRLLRNIVSHRYLIGNFVARDLKVKYRGTVGGYLWSLLEPLALVLIYWFLFVVIAQRGGNDFALVIVLGLLPWTYFAAVVQGSANALRNNAGLVRRIAIPRDVYVMAAAASSLVVLLLSMGAVIPFMIWLKVVPGPMILLWPLAMLLLSTFAIGVGLIVVCANVIYRDVSYVLSVLLRIGIYFSAGIYPVSMVPEQYRYTFLFNPLALCLSMARNAVLNRPPPYQAVHVISAVSVAVFLAFFGAWVFTRWEKKVVKYL